MSKIQINRLPGMRDMTGQAYQRITEVVEGFSRYMRGSGYEAIDTPVLEDTELFVRKSGGELTSRLYSFMDPGGHQVSLRPEFTSSVIRYFVLERESLSLPVRWQYGGPVFRYEQGSDGAYRQYTQLGAELIGAGGVDADAEVLSRALLGLQEMGLRGCKVRVGHLGVLREILALHGLSERANLFITGNVQAMKNGVSDVAGLMNQASELGLLRTGFDHITEKDLATMRSETNREFIEGVLADAMPGSMGRRTADEIVERLLRKVHEADDSDKMEGALALVSELTRVEGRPAAALKSARAIIAKHGIKKEVFDGLDSLFAALTALGIGESDILLDLGLAREISYYTGVIFEINEPASPDGVPLGGGGRYDGLVKALGGGDLPALGFAYTLDRVVDALAREGSETSKASPASSKAGE